MYKHIKAQFEYVSEDRVEVTILEQTHILKDFSFPQDKGIFISKKGISLHSEAFPEIELYYPRYFYVRGWDYNKDLNKIICTLEEAGLLKEVIEEYNETFRFKPHTEIVG